ncbi:MAG: sensor histidine kinase KdpD [Actinobacteria bacterium]|nr:sensor histidine kinase KdpD [Actinomycetota bacterium]
MKAENGRLTVFLGAAHGVGKTWAMLQSAHERISEGLEVTAGWVDTHGEREADGLLRGISPLPPRVAGSSNASVQEMDLDAILLHKPDIVLVDGLERSNSPGSRHNRCYLDIEELLDAGISVYTTINIQYVESLSDIAHKITGMRTEEKVPDIFFERANMVQLVDVPAEVLIQRFMQGKVHTPGLSAEEASRYFRKDIINELRELALRYIAHRVDMDLTAGKTASGISEVLPSVERVLACIGPSPFGSRVLRAAKHLSDNLKCELIALYVDVPEAKLDSSDYSYVEENIKLAGELGAEVIQAIGRDVAATILETATERNATQLVLGRPIRHRWKEFLRGSIVDRIISESNSIELHLIPGSREELPKRNDLRRLPLDRPKLAKYIFILILIGLVTLVCKVTGTLLDLTDVAMLYLLPVLYAGAFVGVLSSILTAIASVLVFDILFVPPLYHITVDDLNYLISFTVFLLVAISTGLLASRLRRKILESSQAENRARTLYSLSQELTLVATVDEFSRVLVQRVDQMFNIVTALYLPESNSLRLAATSTGDTKPFLKESEAQAAYWAFEHGQTAGAKTESFTDAKATYYPLKTEDDVIGVIGFMVEQNPSAAYLKQEETFQAIAALASLALNKLLLAITTQHVRALEASDRLWNALFDSVSHDLRTPLSSITGAATTLMDQSTEFTPEQRISLLRNIERGSAQMNRLVGKLLDMARVESGSLHIETEWCDVQDIVGVALSEFSEAWEDHKITVAIQPDMPLIQVDFGLMVQVQINLIDNAIKYSPEGTEIEIIWEVVGEDIVSSVSDRGLGISQPDKEAIFDKFIRLNAAHPVQGTGLGLSICKGIVEAHHGRIWVEDRPGGGSLFSFSLPVEKLYPEMMEEMEGG